MRDSSVSWLWITYFTASNTFVVEIFMQDPGLYSSTMREKRKLLFWAQGELQLNKALALISTLRIARCNRICFPTALNCKAGLWVNCPLIVPDMNVSCKKYKRSHILMRPGSERWCSQEQVVLLCTRSGSTKELPPSSCNAPGVCLNDFGLSALPPSSPSWRLFIEWKSESVSCSSDSLQLHGLYCSLPRSSVHGDSPVNFIERDVHML